MAQTKEGAEKSKERNQKRNALLAPYRKARNERIKAAPKTAREQLKPEDDAYQLQRAARIAELCAPEIEAAKLEYAGHLARIDEELAAELGAEKQQSQAEKVAAREARKAEKAELKAAKAEALKARIAAVKAEVAAQFAAE